MEDNLVDLDTDTCDMRIRFLDLDDDSFEYWSFDTWLPSYAVLDNTVLDYLLEETPYRISNFSLFYVQK